MNKTIPTRCSIWLCVERGPHLLYLAIYVAIYLAIRGAATCVLLWHQIASGTSSPPRHTGTPYDSTLNPGKGGAGRCVSLGSVYVAARVGAVCLLACVIACGLCEVPGGAQLRLALVCGWSAVSRREQTEHHKTQSHSFKDQHTVLLAISSATTQPFIHSKFSDKTVHKFTFANSEK